MARSVVLYPYLLSRASIMNGMKILLAPDAAEIIPNAMPFLTTHHCKFFGISIV